MKKMFTIIMSVVMMLMVADVRLTANATEVAATTVETVADVNGDGDVNTKDAEVIVDDIIHNPNTQYCVADWVRVSKIVEEKIGPAICGYDISEMDVNPKNNEFVLNELASASDLKVELENGVTFTRSEENATEVFKFDNCETNPSSDINFFGRFTAVDSMGKTRFFELGSIDGHYVLSRGLSSPIKEDPIESDSTKKNISSLQVELKGEPSKSKVFFKVEIRGEFTLRGEKYGSGIFSQAYYNLGVGECLVIQDIEWYGDEAPVYNINVCNIPEDLDLETDSNITGSLSTALTNVGIQFSPKLSDNTSSFSTKIRIIANSFTDDLDGKEAQFKVSLVGEFWYGGEKFNKIEIPATVIVGGEDWVSQEIFFNEAPFYKIEDDRNNSMYAYSMIECSTGLHDIYELSGQLLTLPRNDIAVMVTG